VQYVIGGRDDVLLFHGYHSPASDRLPQNRHDRLESSPVHGPGEPSVAGDDIHEGNPTGNTQACSHTHQVLFGHTDIEELLGKVFFENIFIDHPGGTAESNREHEIAWDLLTAGDVISVIPVIVLFFFIQKRLISGMTVGAVKT
jgi:hypothetical protein